MIIEHRPLMENNSTDHRSRLLNNCLSQTGVSLRQSAHRAEMRSGRCSRCFALCSALDVCGPVFPRSSRQQTGVIFVGSGNVNISDQIRIRPAARLTATAGTFPTGREKKAKIKSKNQKITERGETLGVRSHGDVCFIYMRDEISLHTPTRTA